MADQDRGSYIHITDEVIRDGAETPSLLEEFKAALAQQTFGITTFRFVGLEAMDVTAEITLSDGQTCLIQLTRQGYQLLSLQTGHLDASLSKLEGNMGECAVFECLEALLRSVSAEYKKTWENSLLERLHALKDVDDD